MESGAKLKMLRKGYIFASYSYIVTDYYEKIVNTTIFFENYLTISAKCDMMGADRAVLSRGMAPKGITVRKVRASQGRITDNVRRG